MSWRYLFQRIRANIVRYEVLNQSAYCSAPSVIFDSVLFTIPTPKLLPCSAFTIGLKPQERKRKQK